MMRYKVTHNTVYQYSSTVSLCQNLIILAPKEGPRLICHDHRLQIRPRPSHLVRRTDFFGNQLHSLSIDQRHRRLAIRSSSSVSVQPIDLNTTANSSAWEETRDAIANQTDVNWLDVCVFNYDSPRIQRSELFSQYAKESFTPGRSIVDSVMDLTGRTHRDFIYDSKSTNVNTRPEEAFQIRKGVCQDFAHVMVACLRSIGLCAKYVSGYLRTNPPPGKERLVGSDESHAWVSLYCGDKIGWLPVDPTNNCICNTDHIPIASGRDYGDVVPMRGVFLGGGKHQLKVTVDVQPESGFES